MSNPTSVYIYFKIVACYLFIYFFIHLLCIAYLCTPPKLFCRSVMAPSVTANILMIFSEALAISPRVLTSEVSFVLKCMSHIVNFDNWQWVWKNLIIDIRLIKKLLCCNTLVKCAFQFHSHFVQIIVQTINSVHVTKFAMQNDTCK